MSLNCHPGDLARIVHPSKATVELNVVDMPQRDAV